MSRQTATVRKYCVDLIKSLEDLQVRQEEANNILQIDEEQRREVEHQMLCFKKSLVDILASTEHIMQKRNGEPSTKKTKRE